MHTKQRKCQTHRAFIVEVRLKRGEPEIGPDGLLTRILGVFAPGCPRGWLRLISWSFRDGVITLIFKEQDREEVRLRLSALGLILDELDEVTRGARP